MYFINIWYQFYNFVHFVSTEIQQINHQSPITNNNNHFPAIFLKEVLDTVQPQFWKKEALLSFWRAFFFRQKEGPPPPTSFSQKSILFNNGRIQPYKCSKWGQQIIATLNCWWLNSFDSFPRNLGSFRRDSHLTVGTANMIWTVQNFEAFAILKIWFVEA